MSKKDNQVAMTIRIPDDLYREIQDKAKSDKRSMNNLIIVLLQESLKK